MTRRRTPPWGVVGTVAAFVFLLCAVLYAVVFHGGVQESQVTKASPAPTTSHTTSLSPVPSPAATPGTSGGITDEQDQITSDPSCDKRIGQSVTTTFRKNVFEYERLRLSPPSISVSASLDELATSQYISDHPESTPNPARADITLTSNTVKSEALCTVLSSTERKMTVVSVITTSRTENGQSTVINQDFEMPQHQTIWYLIKGNWKVNNE